MTRKVDASPQDAERNLSDLGTLLRRFRLAAGLGQEALAERARLSVNAISALERGVRRAPLRETVRLLAEGLSLDTGDRAALEAAANAAREPNRPRARQETRYGNASPNNLPRLHTSFVGRNETVAEIVELIERSPFVTLVGSGGVGKTRCAVEVGTMMLHDSCDGVWFVEFAQISDPLRAASAVAQTLNVPESPNRSLLDTLIAYLKRKRLLLIFDNCEHVIDEARSVARALLRDCPDVRILATSREALNIAGELVHRMPSLAVPLARSPITPADIERYGALQLFVDRATTVDRRFAFTGENATYVVEVCRQLDGIPLAIELAAARVNVLSPQQLLKMLDERFRVLTGGDRSALPRQQTLRALIDWSYDLLSDDERSVFRKLSVFAGGLTLENAGAVCGDERADEIAVLDLLSSLVDKSLLQTEPAGDNMRYYFLESTQQYAREKLTACGEFEAVARAHAIAYLTLAEQLECAHETTPDRVWRALVEPEMENWRAAMEWALTKGNDVILGQRLVGALRLAYSYLGPIEGRARVRAALEAVDAATPAAVVAKLELADALFGAAFSRHKECLATAERALARYRELGDASGTAEAQRRAGSALLYLGRVAEGEALLTDTLAAARALDAPKLAGLVLRELAMARQFSGDVPGARTRFSDALTIFRAIGAERLAGIVAGNLAEAEFFGGDAAAALRLIDEALAADRAGNYTLSVAIDLLNAAAYLIALCRYDEARSRARESLAIARDAHYDYGVVSSIQHLAAVCALRPNNTADDQVRAARLLGYVDARLAAIDIEREDTEGQEYDRVLSVLLDVLGDFALANLTDEGRAWSEDQASAEALSV